MPLLRVVLRFALRNRVRTLITSMGVATALLAFVLLRALVDNWYTVQESQDKHDRMIIRNKISIVFPLAVRQVEKLRQIPGVTEASWFCWFAGKYEGEAETFPQQAIDSERYLRIYPEYVPPGDQLEAFLGDMTGALVGERLAEREGWKLGDRVVLEGTIYPGLWELTVRGIYPAKKDVNAEFLFLHYRHLDERISWKGYTQRMLARVDGPEVAKEIDRVFAYDEFPTKTMSEFATQRQWASWSAGVVSAINGGSLLVLLVLTLVLGNAMAMATRDATREYACMRAIGYKPRHVTALVLAEGAVVASIGVVVALLVSSPVLEACSTILAENLGGSWDLELAWPVVASGAGVGLLLALLASAWPAWRSSRASIVTSLRRVA